MAKRKLEIKATPEQLELLYNSLKGGSPLQIALQRAGISLPTYYYWVAVSSIALTAKNQAELEELEDLAQSGVSIQMVRDIAAAQSATKKTGVCSYIEPSGESLLQYKNNRKFKKFADQCFDIISQCDKLRSDFAALQLFKIAQSTQKKNGINPSGAMWWLERNLPDFFAKPSDKAKETENESLVTEPIKVEFVDPTTKETKDRIADMEERILREMKGQGEA